MTKDEMQLLRDFRSEVPAPEPETVRRAYAYATGEPRRGALLALPRVSPLHLRVVLPVAAAIGAAVCAVVFTGTLGGSSGHPSGSLVQRGGKPHSGRARALFAPMTLNFTYSGQAVTSIAVTVKATIADATVQLQVLRSDAARLPEANDASSKLVFQEQIPLTNIASPPPDAARSTWSGTLSPSDWDGGCQPGLYTVKTVVVPAGSSSDNPVHTISQAAWFRCSPGS
jgi:hypothetical protein